MNERAVINHEGLVEEKDHDGYRKGTLEQDTA